MTSKIIIFFLALFLSNFFNAQGIHIGTEPEKGIKLINWELYLIQNPNGTPEGTSPILIKDSQNLPDSIDLNRFTGVCWFKKVFKADSVFVNKSQSIRLSLIGAAEIFINKKKISQAGVVSSNSDSEISLNTNRHVFSYNFQKDSIYEILIRYSNHEQESSYNSRGEHVFGITVSIGTTEGILRAIMRDRMSNSNFGTMFFVFFMTLFLVHLAIFLFNRADRSNLYYSLFCFLVSTLVMGLFGSRFTSYHSILQIIGLFVFISPIFIFTLLPYMLRAFFALAPPRWYRAFLIFALICIVSFFLSMPYIGLLMTLLITVGSIESLRNLILAFKQKKKGVKIIGSGLVLFTISLLISALGLWYASTVSTTSQVFGTIYMLIFFSAILSIPFCITAFLAYSISSTNRELANKLIEVQDLSAKSIAQEKEKQQILETQNVTLEKQVNKRTQQLNEQKKLIEEKNKDIIDSINYARRIQAAMLPEEKQFKQIFNDSFIIYQPRDIVSGDFYYVAELGDNKLILAADCTGHGVPGALMSMVGCNIINKLTHENKISDPKAILETLHIELRHALKQDLQDSMNRDGMDVAAVLITDDEIVYAAANRPLIYFDKENNLQELKPSKIPIGGSHNQTVSIEQHRILKSQVSQIFLFSDGFADQFGGPQGKKLMVSKFKLWLIQISTLSSENQFQFLTKNFQEWKQNSEQVDDVMVIGIRI